MISHGTLETFVITASSARHHESFRVSPRYGVMALSSAYTESTALSGESRRLAREALSYVELGLAPSIANVPGLAKFEHPPREMFTPARLVASFRLAHERFRQQHPAAVDIVATSLVAVCVEGGRATLVSVGPDAHAWAIRGGRAEILVGAANGRERDDPWLGRADAIAPRVVEVSLASGELIVLGPPAPAVIGAFVEHGARLDHALARSSALLEDMPCVLLAGRWCA